MKKSVLTSICCACLLVLLLSACVQNEPNPSVHLDNTDPSKTTDPTMSPTQPMDPTSPTAKPTEPSDQPTVPPTNPPTEPLTEPPTQPTDPETGLPVYIPGSIKLTDQDVDEYSFERKYRQIYYMIYGPFIDLLNDEQKNDFYAWANETAKADNYGEFQTEMMLASFVKRYDISREEFDKAVEKFVSLNSFDSLKTEFREPPNADIIYTFDNEIINEYYRYA